MEFIKNFFAADEREKLLSNVITYDNMMVGILNHILGVVS